RDSPMAEGTRFQGLPPLETVAPKRANMLSGNPTVLTQASPADQRTKGKEAGRTIRAGPLGGARVRQAIPDIWGIRVGLRRRWAQCPPPPERFGVASGYP